MTTQHSPAPWINDGNTITAQVDPSEPSYIAPVCFLDGDWLPEIVAANARLIAAAPELLASLREIVTAIESDDADGYSPSGDWFREAKAAIAKATGEAK